MPHDEICQFARLGRNLERDVIHTVKAVNPDALSQYELHRLIDEIQIGLAGIDEAVRETYFA